MAISYLLILISILITAAAQIIISVNYKKYSQIENSKQITGVEAAQEILKHNGLENIYVVETHGYLSDHYDSNQNVIRLSSNVFHGKSISSLAVAAHEVGHAIQNKEGNIFMKLRQFIFPIVNLSSKFGYLAIFIGIIFGAIKFFYLGIGMLCTILLFQLITLPVEIDASKKGMENLKKYNLLNSHEQDGAFKVLFAAALTYVASMVTTLLEIARLLIMTKDE